jgi:nucleotide-binding universal stress UspA family protein
MKLDHILLPTDLSPQSTRASEDAPELAVAGGGQLTLLTVVPEVVVAAHGAPLAPPIGDPEAPAKAAAAHAQLKEMAQDLERDGVKVNVKALHAADTVRAILDYAEANDVDLIALSTHGHGGWRRLVLGSVAERVVRESSIPVLTFHRE